VRAGRLLGPALMAALMLVTGRASADDKLVHASGAVEIDWGAGTISARGGSAPDLRLPTAEMARPGAERRARGRAQTSLRDALDDMPLGPHDKLSSADIDAALARAHQESIEYQSNGGVLLRLGLSFAELAPTKETPAKPAPVPQAKVPEHALSVATMPFELAPRLRAGEREQSVAWAVYRMGAPPADVKAIAVRRDGAGRLVLPKGEGKAFQKLAGAPVVIYVQKTFR
jgi:hypothetical protein